MIGKAKYEVTHDTIKQALQEYLSKQHTKSLKVLDVKFGKASSYEPSKWEIELEFIEPCATDLQSTTESVHSTPKTNIAPSVQETSSSANDAACSQVV